HPYAVDLDLFGAGSLFDLVGTARTPAGMHRLAQWLSGPSEPKVIRERQDGVEDLRERVALREDLALLADGVAASVHPDVLTRWGEREAYFKNPALAGVLAWVLTVAAVVALVLWPLTALGPIPLVVVATIQALVGRWLRREVEGVTATIENPQRELRVLAEVLARVEAEQASSSMLKRELERLRAKDGLASKAIGGLIGRVVWLDAMRNQFFYPIGFLLMWNLHLSLSIERWRLSNGGRIAGWLDALGDVEALAALSGFAFENPSAVFPEIVEDRIVYRAKGLGHPLLPAGGVVRNDIEFSDAPRVYLVSGSNMSGKSTMLRTVGLNAVLALSGAPVRAHELQISPVAVGASIRTQDSLLSGKSRFYAEIVRLKQVLDLAHEQMPALFLLDEILHGTNSHDRRLGAAAILQGFLDTDAIGLITTHDLALADAAAELAPRVRNVHFADELVDGELEFDYTLRDGVVQRSNAIELMRAVGLKV
ncbi:MAG: DNA mismatch repair protein MutS, partial [Myxococcota bacterium]